MKPSDAFAKMAHDEIERVEIDQLEGRITAVLLTPYPPGIPLLIPGEKFNKTIVDYLKFARDVNQKLPGFETDITVWWRKKWTEKNASLWIACFKKPGCSNEKGRAFARPFSLQDLLNQSHRHQPR